MWRGRTCRVLVVGALVGLMAGPAGAQDTGRKRGEKYALLIGVRQYAPDVLRPLPYAEADVTELAGVLERSGFRRENVTIMTQKIGADDFQLLPSSENIRRQLRLTLKPLDENDGVVVALAGHGVQFADNQDSFFCPMDADLDREASLIKFSELSKSLEDCHAGFKLLLVDACRNNPRIATARPVSRPVVDLPSLSKPFVRRPPGGVAALFSCSPGEIAYEDPKLQHGVFFHYAIRGLSGNADLDGDGKVDVLELEKFVEKNVALHVGRLYRREQTVEFVNRLRTSITIVEPGRQGSLITNSLGMKLKLIPAGQFLMGSSPTDKEVDEDEKPWHWVRITRPFYLGTTEVTVGQFRRFVEATGYQTEAEKDAKGGFGVNEEGKWVQNPKFTWRSPGFEQTDGHPVVDVSWHDAVAFCEWISQQEGQTYRLPTEAEWEYSCRAGTRTRYWVGDDAEELAGVGNVADATAKAKYSDWTTISGRDGFLYTAPVGQFRPNAFGLYDMHGNVWEWCSDWYESRYYSQSPVDDPSGPLQAALRVIRGGSWGDDPRDCRSAGRFGLAPEIRYDDLGFRVAQVPSGQ